MKITSIKCPNCKSNLNVKEGDKIIECEFCRQKIYLEEDGVNIKISIDDSIKQKIKVPELTKEDKKAIKTAGVAVGAIVIIGIIIGLIIFGLIGFNISKSIKKQKVETFNFTYEQESGEQNGLFVKSTLDDVITNNKKEKKHIIKVEYNNEEAKNIDEITKIKQRLDMIKKYEVAFEYDDDGYINMIKISSIKSQQ